MAIINKQVCASLRKTAERLGIGSLPSKPHWGLKLCYSAFTQSSIFRFAIAVGIPEERTTDAVALLHDGFNVRKAVIKPN
jgi:hypothetical protein